MGEKAKDVKKQALKGLLNLKYTVKPVWKDNPQCQQKVVLPDRWYFLPGLLCRDFNYKREIFTNGQTVFPAKVIFPDGVFPDRCHLEEGKTLD